MRNAKPSTSPGAPRDVTVWARRLGYAGLIPFVVGASAIWLLQEPSSTDLWGQAVLAYGAVILSFVGAVLWGIVISEGEAVPRPAQLIMSVVPALLGWLSLLIGPTLGFPVQFVAFISLHACERSGLWCPELPSWYLRLRTQLTAVVALTSAVAGCGVLLS